MLKRFYPDDYVDSAYEIPYEELYKKGYRGIVFDVDNTLVEHGAPVTERAVALFERLRKTGYDTCIISNNKEPRVRPLAEAVHSKYVSDAKKPSPKNYIKAMECMKTDVNTTFFVGDQLFTDVWGANRAGMMTILVKDMGEIKGTTRVCGLIGNPVGHSISPVIHNTLADLCGIDMVYTTFKVEKGAVDTAVKGAYALDILGLNVTVPHKQEVIGTLESVDPLAEAIGAVNTLVRTEHGYKGYNTDILGLERELEEEQVELKDSPVILLGAGGAARAIAFLCVSKGAKEVAILNRTEEKAAVIAEDVNRHLQSKAAYAMKLSDYGKLTGENYVVIQTTSVGLYPNCDDAVIEDEDFYKRAAVGVDIIYNPAETKFMKLMKAQGKPAYNGLKMLLYQGVSAFELWNDIKISKENIRKVYENMQKKLG